MKWLNENLFAAFMAAAGLGLGLYADKLPSTSIEISAVKLQNGGLFFATLFAFVFVLCGIKTNLIQDEIVAKQNTAVAQLIGLIAIAISILYTVNS